MQLMMPSRRDVLRLGAFGAGTLLLPRSSFPTALRHDADPHFFLLVVLNGGADSSYMFDARPLSMTKAGKIQNYLGKEPDPWIGKNGGKALATSLIKPLAPFRDRFRVLNGVCMAPPSCNQGQCSALCIAQCIPKFGIGICLNNMCLCQCN